MIICTNAQGLINNLDHVKLYEFLYSVDIFCLTETHLTECVEDSEISLGNFNLVRCDSTSSHTGGVIIYVHKNYKFKVENIRTIKMCLWYINLTVYIDGKPVTIAVIYRSPSYPVNLFLQKN